LPFGLVELVIQTLRLFRHWMLSVLPIYIHQSWQHGFSRMSVVVALIIFVLIFAVRRCSSIVFVLCFFVLGSVFFMMLFIQVRILCVPEIIYVHTLDRMALARSSRRAPPSHHLRKRSLLRFEVHGCREVGLVLR
jgi:hypothetical protein